MRMSAQLGWAVCFSAGSARIRTTRSMLMTLVSGRCLARAARARGVGFAWWFKVDSLCTSNPSLISRLDWSESFESHSEASSFY